MRKLVLGAAMLAALMLDANAARAAVGDAPAGYQLVNVTKLGRSFTTQKAGVQTVTAALQATLRDLTRYFNARPTVRRAYEDARDHRSGGAAFTVNSGGPIKGLIFCKIGPRGASIAVIGARADVSAAEWRSLMASSGGASAPANAGPGASAAAKPVPAAPGSLRQVSFKDGTGTIGLPPGWTTDLGTCAWGVIVQGPGDQRVAVATQLNVWLPSSPYARSQQAMGTGVVGPFMPPADALRTLAPQMSRMAARNRLKPFVLDNVAEKQRLPATFPGGRSSMVTYGTTENGRRGRQHYKNLSQLDLVPPKDGMWALRFGAELRAPDATFDRDLPLMLAIAKSWRGDDAAMGRRINGQTATNQRRFESDQRKQREKSDAFDRYIADQEQASNARLASSDAATRASNDRLRSASDFDEVIRGYRTVEDTRTGQRTSVDLGDVDKIVDTLNERDPDRYKQIPLRDEAEGN